MALLGTMTRFKTNDQIGKEERQKAEDADKAKKKFESSLALHITKIWERNKRAKIDVENQFAKNLRQRNSEYEPDKLAVIRKSYSSEIYMALTYIKCKALEAWLSEAYALFKGRTWSLMPTPLPDLRKDKVMEIEQKVSQTVLQAAEIYIQATQQSISPEEFNNVANEHFAELKDQEEKLIIREAKETMERMSLKIDDQLSEGNWYKAFKEARSDLSTFGVGILKGPIVRKPKRLEWVQNELGKWTPDFRNEALVEYERVSPFDLYPEDDATDIQDGNLIERMRLSRKDLNEMIGVPGYNDQYLKEAINKYDKGLRTPLPPDSDRADVEGRTQAAFLESNKIEVLSFWGSVQGKMLLEWGMDDVQITDPDLDYDINAWKIGEFIVRAVINKSGVNPYSMSWFEKIPGSVWGKGLPQVLSDTQDMVNSSARAIQNNQAYASGPMVEVDISKFPAGTNITRVTPWMVLQSNTEGMKEGQAVRFYQPSSIVGELMNVFTKFMREADEKSGIPAYAHGDPKTGGSGNALANYEKILTPNGTKEIGNIKEGDLVVNSYGSFSKVTGVFPQGESDIYRLKFSHGEHVDCDMQHRWAVKIPPYKFKTLTTEQILKKGLFWNGRTKQKNPREGKGKWAIPLIDFIEFEYRKVKIDPYTMGALIGDGDARCRITGMDKEIFDRIPYPLGRPSRSEKTSKAWTCTIKGISKNYLSYGLNCKSIDKFIPEDYLFNTKEVRLELLRGLLDTDGNCSKQGKVFFSTSSYRLAEDFVKLVRSLGAVVCSICKNKAKSQYIRGKKYFSRESYRVSFTLPNEKVFYLQRKQERVKEIHKIPTRIIGIEYIGKANATCISVDSKNSLFICENFIPTHNTASGFSMFLSLAGKVVNDIIENIDLNLIVPTIDRTYNHNMMYDEDESIKGDAKVMIKGVSSIVVKEQEEMKRSEFLRDTINPIDMQIIGLEGRREVLKSRVKSLGMDTDKIIPDVPLQLFPVQNVKGTVPAEKPQTLDVAGNPSGGVDANQFNSVSQKGGRL